MGRNSRVASAVPFSDTSVVTPWLMALSEQNSGLSDMIITRFRIASSSVPAMTLRRWYPLVTLLNVISPLEPMEEETHSVCTETHELMKHTSHIK